MLKIYKWQVNSKAIPELDSNYIKQEGVGRELFKA